MVLSFLLSWLNRWEGLRQQALSRQTLLHEKLMNLQRSEMQKLRTWMTETEDKISRSVKFSFSILFPSILGIGHVR